MASLSPNPIGYDLEDYISANLVSRGCYVETSIHERNPAEILEIDIIWRDYRPSNPVNIPFEVKSGVWCLGDVFKFFGWTKYLGIQPGYFVHRTPFGRNEKVLQHICERTGVSFRKITNIDDYNSVFSDLGALVEGAMQLLLITFDEAYKKNTQARRDKKNRILDAEEIRFEDLRDFCNRNVWNPVPAVHSHIIAFRNWNPYVSFVQNRRNAIHSIKRREIGSFDEWRKMLPVHLSFIRDMFQSSMESRYAEDNYPDEDDWW